ncbi:MAG: hypothetical protein KDI62_15975, partial [Anaerolineae bacterium]|nr:hypothetical protein [Anaerolineae bacterium]
MKKLIVVFTITLMILFAATPTFAAGPESPPLQGVLAVDDLSSTVRVQDFSGSSNQIAIKYYNESGTETSGKSTTLNTYSGTTIDQKTDIAATSFRGSGVIEAAGDSGAVALLYSSAGSSAGSNYRSDVYPTAVDFSEAVGANVYLPQVVGNVSDSGTGTTVNDTVAVMNTTDQAATGTATFTPLAGGASKTVNLNIPAFASQYIDAGAALGSGFNGSAKISMNSGREVMAVVSRTSSGSGKKSLQAFVSVTNAATGTPINFPQVLKNISDSGFSFSTGIACVSLGTSGQITAVYTPTGSGSSKSETKSGSVIQFDQRANSNLGTKFFGSARLTVKSGGPYACIINKVGPSSSNLRNDTTPGVVSGSDEVFFPFFFKGTSIGGQNQSSAIQVQSLNGAFTGEVTAQFYKDSGGSPVSISSS